MPFFSRLDTFNGPDHTEDPRDKGFVSSDGEHTIEPAWLLTDEILSEMGYEPTIP